MAWTWTGYDHDAVYRFKPQQDFFTTGRNEAEARWWRMKVTIHFRQ